MRIKAVFVACPDHAVSIQRAMPACLIKQVSACDVDLRDDVHLKCSVSECVIAGCCIFETSLSSELSDHFELSPLSNL
jgi:hypothetical protein